MDVLYGPTGVWVASSRLRRGGRGQRARVAAQVSIALVAAQNEEHLHAAIDNRTVIGRAQGILMERFHIDATTAFGVLTRFSAPAHRLRISHFPDPRNRRYNAQGEPGRLSAIDP